MTEEPKIVKDKRSLVRPTYRFKGEHGIYILFSSYIIDIVAKDSKLTPREASILLFAYYISKYIAFSAVIFPDLISFISKEMNFNYTAHEIRKLIVKLYELKPINKYGDVYVINRDTQDWIKAFTNQLTYKLHNFNRIGFYESLKKKRGMTMMQKRQVERHNRMARRVSMAQQTGKEFPV